VNIIDLILNNHLKVTWRSSSLV